MPSIIKREDWGAKYNDGFYNRKVGRLDKWLHHTVTTQLSETAKQAVEMAEVRELERIGQSRFKGGISYTFVVFPSGRIYEGHSIGRVGAHTKGQNSISVGIALAGNYEINEVTSAQKASLAWLLNHGVEKGWWTENKLDGGHRDTKATACPGKLAYAQIKNINKLADGHPSKPAPSKPKPDQTNSNNKTIQQMASEVRAGKHGNGHAQRQKSLGISAALYEKVRAEVNKRLGVKPSKPAPSKPKKPVSQMATEVIQGKHGNGHANRQKSLGISNAEYAKVRSEVNKRA